MAKPILKVIAKNGVLKDESGKILDLSALTGVEASGDPPRIRASAVFNCRDGLAFKDGKAIIKDGVYTGRVVSSKGKFLRMYFEKTAG